MTTIVAKDRNFLLFPVMGEFTMLFVLNYGGLYVFNIKKNNTHTINSRLIFFLLHVLEKKICSSFLLFTEIQFLSSLCRGGGGGEGGLQRAPLSSREFRRCLKITKRQIAFSPLLRGSQKTVIISLSEPGSYQLVPGKDKWIISLSFSQ